MRVRAIVLVIMLALMPLSARAQITPVADPDKWIEQALQDISEGKVEEFARNYTTHINQPNILPTFIDHLRPLTRSGPPAFVEKAWDARYGDALREVIYVALYGASEYVYFKFTIKRQRSGWLITFFEFKGENGRLFPQGFVTPR